MALAKRLFYPNMTSKYADRSIIKALHEGFITDDDVSIIQRYIRERTHEKNLSEGRQLKNLYTLVHWRRFIPAPYLQATYDNILTGIEELKRGKNAKGEPFKQNTLHDYIRILKPFLLWMIENNLSSIPEKKVSKISAPPVDYQTTSPDEILTKDDVLALIGAAKDHRDQALLAVLYESGARIGELARLRWRDIGYDDKPGAKLYISDTKTNKQRYSRLTWSVDYLHIWRQNYPGEAKGDNPVFLTYSDKPLEYATVQAMLRRLCDRAEKKLGWKRKHVHPHLFRKSRITHMISENYQESTVKESMWGNVATGMFRTYVKLSENNIDAEFLEKAGLAVGNDIKEEPIRPRTCGVCHKVNEAAARYCSGCGTPLTKEAAARITELKNELEQEQLKPEYRAIMDEFKMKLIQLQREKG